jgi:uncharacterized protein YjeT (DUF2065 family)
MADYWWAALGLVLIIEGLGPMFFPNRWRSYLRKIADQPTVQMQQLGGFFGDRRSFTADFLCAISILCLFSY